MIGWQDLAEGNLVYSYDRKTCANPFCIISEEHLAYKVVTGVVTRNKAKEPVFLIYWNWQNTELSYEKKDAHQFWELEEVKDVIERRCLCKLETLARMMRDD